MSVCEDLAVVGMGACLGVGEPLKKNVGQTISGQDSIAVSVFVVTLVELRKMSVYPSIIHQKNNVCLPVHQSR